MPGFLSSEGELCAGEAFCLPAGAPYFFFISASHAALTVKTL